MRAGWWVPSPRVTAATGWDVITRPLPLFWSHLTHHHSGARGSLRSRWPGAMFVQISPPKKIFFLYASCTDSTGCKVYSLSLWSLVISENHRTAKSILSAQVVSKVKVSELDFILQWMNIGVTWEKICRIFLFTKLIVFALFPRFSISEEKWISFVHSTM